MMLLKFIQFGSQLEALAVTHPQLAADLVRLFGDLIQAIRNRDAVAIERIGADLKQLAVDASS